ncbi:inosine triphosphate pyrophosphatase-like protein [Chytriomyces cf. hyalinus JEL632]|nr:inosine triphosphate pyrophosphatase-like protein [Chytriomyces cf. hyalinus JEL632]
MSQQSEHRFKLNLPSADFTFVLGSSSKSRALVLNKHQISYEVAVAEIDEKAIGDRDLDQPAELVLRIANAKANALIASGKLDALAPAIVVCCDQVAVYKGRIREKPENEAQAREYLTSYRTAPVETYGGVVVYNTLTGKRAATVDIAKQHFKFIPDDVIDALVALGRVYSCAGGFTIEDPLLVPYLGDTEGEDGGWDSIVGLSLTVVQRLIEQTK